MSQQKIFPDGIAKHPGHIFLLVFACLVAFLALTYPYEKPRDQSIPTYITHIWPAPNDEVWGFWYDFFLFSRRIGPMMDFQGGISIRLDTIGSQLSDLERLDKYDPDNKFPLFSERVILYLDGNLLSNASRSGFEAGAELRDDQPEFKTGVSTIYLFHWSVSLTNGKHTAKLSMATRSGEVLEYTWEFMIK